MPGLKAHAAPGHTPGHLVFVIEGKERDAIFTGDAAKNRAELLSRKGEATYDATLSKASIERIWQLWAKAAGQRPHPRPRPADDAKGRTHRIHRQAQGGAQDVVRRGHRDDRADRIGPR